MMADMVIPVGLLCVLVVSLIATWFRNRDQWKEF